MGGIGVLGLELRHPGLCFVTPADRLDTGNKTAFFDDQFVVGWRGERKGHELGMISRGRGKHSAQ
jgi:hypothetical protein